MNRYERQLSLVGEEGQQMLVSSRVGIVGCGGLGVNVLTHLVQAGIMDFVLCDGGFPEISGLNSQFIYAPGDMRPKASIAAEWVLALNYTAMAQAHSEPIGPENVQLLVGSAVVVDCTGDEGAGSVIAEWCSENGVPLIRGRCDGMVGCIDVCVGPVTFPVEASADGVPKLGSVVSVIAGMMSTEAIRMIVRPESSGRRIVVDAASWNISVSGGGAE